MKQNIVPNDQSGWIFVDPDDRQTYPPRRGKFEAELVENVLMKGNPQGFIAICEMAGRNSAFAPAYLTLVQISKIRRWKKL